MLDLADGTRGRGWTQSEVPAPARPVVAPYGEGAFYRRRGGYQPPAFLIRAGRPRNDGGESLCAVGGSCTGLGHVPALQRCGGLLGVCAFGIRAEWSSISSFFLDLKPVGGEMCAGGRCGVETKNEGLLLGAAGEGQYAVPFC